MIGERIKEERERLGMTQPDFAAAAGAAKRTLIEWEKGNTSPTLVQLSALITIGADAQYILTGIRSGTAPGAVVLTVREEKLLDNYRALPDEEGKRCVEKVVLMAAGAAQDATQSRTKKAG